MQRPAVQPRPPKPSPPLTRVQLRHAQAARYPDLELGVEYLARVAGNLQTIAIAGTSVTHAYRGDFFIEGAPDWEERP